MLQNTLTQKKLKVAMAGFLIMLASIALISSSFAWLQISRTPIVSDLELSVMTDSRLEIAPDENGRPGDWDVVLDLSSLLEDIVPLKPVTYSKINNVLYTPLYDIDGRFTGQTVALSDDVNANVKGTGNSAAESRGYYIAVTFWVRGGQSADICLSEAKEIEEGLAGHGTYLIGNPIWNGQTYVHENGGNGLETAIRIGFRCQETDLDGRYIGSSKFLVYEPNSDTHSSADLSGYVETTSIDGGALVESGNLIRQTTSTWNETTPVLSDSVVYSLGDFTDNPTLFRITSATMQKVTMYVWLEGRDVDCINQIMKGETSLLGCIQLSPDSEEYNTGIERD